MEASVDLPMILGFLNGVEATGLLAVILILFGLRGDGRDGFIFAVREFIFAVRELLNTGEDVGRSIGGITGSLAFEAITPKNEVAEIYDPGPIDNKHRRRLSRWWKWLFGIYVRGRSTRGKIIR